eukprot:TRINITY_DN1069_c0_g1_i3.p3 TRINITY_DN1069_c0_g1~~TRINITY_DN1069_c0_g1_i3.p3  ORF type:complete len:157 (-),score=0.74 TRINITY_DN1069_c0_g1_i3:895-1365(-)
MVLNQNIFHQIESIYVLEKIMKTYLEGFKQRDLFRIFLWFKLKSFLPSREYICTRKDNENLSRGFLNRENCTIQEKQICYIQLIKQAIFNYFLYLSNKSMSSMYVLASNQQSVTLNTQPQSQQLICIITRAKHLHESYRIDGSRLQVEQGEGSNYS